MYTEDIILQTPQKEYINRIFLKEHLSVTI